MTETRKSQSSQIETHISEPSKSPFYKGLMGHFFVFGAFVGAVFTLGQLVNGTSVQDSLAKLPGTKHVAKLISDIAHPASANRNPAMLRLNPGLGAGKVSSIPLEISPFELSRFAITTPGKNFERGVDATHVEAVKARGFDYGLILPSSLAPAQDGGQVASQILDHSVSNWLHQDAMKNSFVGQAAHAVENTMKADVAFGGESPESTKHNVKFQMKATDAKAQMEYSGITNAEVSYSVTSKQMNLEVYEPIAGDAAKVVYTHSNQPSENRDMLSLRMNW